MKCSDGAEADSGLAPVEDQIEKAWKVIDDRAAKRERQRAWDMFAAAALASCANAAVSANVADALMLERAKRIAEGEPET